MSGPSSTRREFLLKLAKGAAYSAPVITTFAVAPDLLAQPGSLPGHGHKGHGQGAASTAAPSEAPGAPAPSEKHPPPSQKGG